MVEALKDPDLTREQLARRLARRYEAGATVRELADQAGISYGKCHELLSSVITLRRTGRRRKTTP
jgi:Helix-turn-helix domain